jgi:hypothetical protein
MISSNRIHVCLSNYVQLNSSTAFKHLWVSNNRHDRLYSPITSVLMGPMYPPCCFTTSYHNSNVDCFQIAMELQSITQTKNCSFQGTAPAAVHSMTLYQSLVVRSLTVTYV